MPHLVPASSLKLLLELSLISSEAKFEGSGLLQRLCPSLRRFRMVYGSGRLHTNDGLMGKNDSLPELLPAPPQITWRQNRQS